jgi:hypothetical protein
MTTGRINQVFVFPFDLFKIEKLDRERALGPTLVSFLRQKNSIFSPAATSLSNQIVPLNTLYFLFFSNKVI